MMFWFTIFDPYAGPQAAVYAGECPHTRPTAPWTERNIKTANIYLKGLAPQPHSHPAPALLANVYIFNTFLFLFAKTAREQRA